MSIRPGDREAFEEAMEGNPCHFLGTVVQGDAITFSRDGEDVLVASMGSLRNAWKGTLDGGVG